jgi:hypothetical protein
VVGLDAGGIEHRPLVRESHIDDVSEVAHHLHRGALPVRPAHDVVHLTEIDPRHQRLLFVEQYSHQVGRRPGVLEESKHRP